MDKVSVIIPTYNRFKYLLNTIKSVQDQTYKNTEIIVINDKSTQEEYYTYDWSKENIIIIHLEKNSKEIYGYGCAAHVRNKGIEICTGKYVAFCDDDDIWFPHKLEKQIAAMHETGCKLSSTDGYTGIGMYDSSLSYPKRLGEKYYKPIINTLKNRRSKNQFNFGLPKIWNFQMLKKTNCIICSSVLIEKSILDTIGNMKTVKNGEEDYDCWLRALHITDSVYVSDPCMYYDEGHGDGQNY